MKARREGWAGPLGLLGQSASSFTLTRYFSLVINNGKLSENTVSQKLSEVVQFWSQHYFYHFCFFQESFHLPPMQTGRILKANPPGNRELRGFPHPYTSTLLQDWSLGAAGEAL